MKKYDVDTMKKFKEEFKSYWSTVTSCPDFTGSKKEEKFILLESLSMDGHIPPAKYNTFYNRIKEGKL